MVSAKKNKTPISNMPPGLFTPAPQKNVIEMKAL